jgi:hypothetical protein
MSHLAAFEAKRSFYLIALAQEANRLVLLCLVVVFVDCDREFDLFDDDDLLFFAGCSLTLILFVKEFAVVLDLAHGRHGVRRDFYKIKGAFAGHLEGVEGGHDAELLTILVDDANFAGADALVGTNKGLGGTFINRWNRSPPQRAIKLAMRCFWVRCTLRKSALEQEV